MFKEEIILQNNEDTGIKAIVYNSGDCCIYIRKGGKTIKMAHRKHIELMMFHYGSSRVMHWNDICAKPNAKKKPSRVRMLDGLLRGYTPCQNCWDRTRAIKN